MFPCIDIQERNFVINKVKLKKSLIFLENIKQYILNFNELNKKIKFICQQLVIIFP